MAELRAEHLSKFYGRKHVVKDVTFSMSSGDVTGLLGPNGAGKTTSFYMIVGFIKANGGSVLVDGHDITDLPMHKRSNMGLAYLPQEASIFRKLSVENNIRLVLETQKGLSKSEKDDMLEKLASVTVPEKCLSCGMTRFCSACPGVRYAETGRPDGIPRRLCDNAREWMFRARMAHGM